MAADVFTGMTAMYCSYIRDRFEDNTVEAKARGLRGQGHRILCP